MAKRRAFTGFGGPAGSGPDPHDVARIGTQVALATGTRAGIEQKAHTAIMEGLAGPAAIADGLAERIGEAVEDGLGEPQTLARAVVDKAQGAFMQSIIGPTETAIGLGWVPKGAPGTGAGGRSRRGRQAGPRPAQAAGPPGQPSTMPAGSRGEAPGMVPGASTANVAGTLPAPGGPPAGSVMTGGPPAPLSPPAVPAGLLGDAGGRALFGGPPLAPEQASTLAPAQPLAAPGGASGQGYTPASPPAVSHWMVLVDVQLQALLTMRTDTPEFERYVATRAVVPVRYEHNPLSEWIGEEQGRELAEGWVGDNPDLAPLWVGIAVHAWNNGGEGWPENGDFPHRAPQTTAHNGCPVGPWPFAPDGSYHGPTGDYNLEPHCAA